MNIYYLFPECPTEFGTTPLPERRRGGGRPAENIDGSDNSARDREVEHRQVCVLFIYGLIPRQGRRRRSQLL